MLNFVFPVQLHMDRNHPCFPSDNPSLFHISTVAGGESGGMSWMTTCSQEDPGELESNPYLLQPIAATV